MVVYAEVIGISLVCWPIHGRTESLQGSFGGSQCEEGKGVSLGWYDILEISSGCRVCRVRCLGLKPGSKSLKKGITKIDDTRNTGYIIYVLLNPPTPLVDWLVVREATLPFQTRTHTRTQTRTSWIAEL